MPDKVYYITADADDGYVDDFGLYATNYQCKIGNDYSPNHSYFRFNNIDIPAGSEITAAKLRVKAYDNRWYDDIDLKVHAVAADNPAAPTTLSEFNALSLTTGTVWDILEGWSYDVQYDTPDITGEVQSVIDRPGWAENNSLIIVIKDTGTIQYYYKEITGYKQSGGSKVVELHITYAAAEVSSAGLALGAEGGTIHQGTIPQSIALGAAGMSIIPGHCEAGLALGAEGETVLQGVFAGIALDVAQGEPYNSTVDAHAEAGTALGSFGESEFQATAQVEAGIALGSFGDQAGEVSAGVAFGASGSAQQSFRGNGLAGIVLGARGEAGGNARSFLALGAVGSIVRVNVSSGKAGISLGAAGYSYSSNAYCEAGVAIGARGIDELVRISEGSAGIALGAEVFGERKVTAQAYAGIAFGAEGKIIVTNNSEGFAGLSIGAGADSVKPGMIPVAPSSILLQHKRDFSA